MELRVGLTARIKGELFFWISTSGVNSSSTVLLLTSLDLPSLSATLKIIFMLCEEQYPPTLLWMSLVVEVEMR